MGRRFDRPRRSTPAHGRHAAGPGVAPSERERIFEAFRRGVDAGGNGADDDPGPRARAGRGVGAGLALVARFAELHGGRVWVEDRPGGGAAFRVVLPEG
ncbi:MAG: ATP-binding protein [Actinomycetota bacterium]